MQGNPNQEEETWILLAYYSGHVAVWNYRTYELVHFWKVSEHPVRAVACVARQRWIATACDDMRLRVYDVPSGALRYEWEAHTDYIRSLEVHPTLPWLLSSSDDMTIKLWIWPQERNKEMSHDDESSSLVGWNCHTTWEGHDHYVMQVKFVPPVSKQTDSQQEDPANVGFISASLDRSIKVWQVGSSKPLATWNDGHVRGINTVDVFRISGDERTFVASGSDDRTVTVWDYEVNEFFVVCRLNSHRALLCCWLTQQNSWLFANRQETHSFRWKAPPTM